MDQRLPRDMQADEDLSAPVSTGLSAAVRQVQHRWFLVLATSAIGLLISVLVLRDLVPMYSAELRLAPASSQNSGSSGMSALSGLASLAGVSVGGAEATPFDLYLDALTSRETATTLATDLRIMRGVFDDEWDETSGGWKAPVTWRSRWDNMIRSVAGLPVRRYQRPDPARLQTRLRDNVIVQSSANGPITTLLYEHRDPEFAIYLLNQVNSVADSKVRRADLNRSRQYAMYLSEKLQTVRIAEHRETLVEALGEQERSIMMASSNVPYAAVPVDTANSSNIPIRPKPALIMLAGLLIGAFVGVLVAISSVAWRVAH
jgi:hypothetical protein